MVPWNGNVPLILFLLTVQALHVRNLVKKTISEHSKVNREILRSLHPTEGPSTPFKIGCLLFVWNPSWWWFSGLHRSLTSHRISETENRATTRWSKQYFFWYRISCILGSIYYNVKKPHQDFDRIHDQNLQEFISYAHQYSDPEAPII